MTYQWVQQDKSVRKLVDGKRVDQCPLIPAEELNSDWREFLAWVAAGNEPLPAEEQS